LLAARGVGRATARRVGTELELSATSVDAFLREQALLIEDVERARLVEPSIIPTR
jgi:hypothetical protein